MNKSDLNIKRIATVFGYSLGIALLVLKVWPNISDCFRHFESEREKYIRDHVNDIIKSTNWPVTSRFRITNLDWKPMEDTFGCFGEIEKIDATIEFEPTDNEYFTDVTNSGYGNILGLAEFNKFNDEDETIKVFTDLNPRVKSMINTLDIINSKFDRIWFVWRVSEDEVKKFHSMRYSDARYKTKDGGWKSINNGCFKLTTPSEHRIIYTTKGLTNFPIHVFCNAKGEPDRKGRKYIEALEKFVKDFNAVVWKLHCSRDMVNKFFSAERTNSKAVEEKEWTCYYSEVTTRSYPWFEGGSKSFNEAQQAFFKASNSFKSYDDLQRLRKLFITYRAEAAKRVEEDVSNFIKDFADAEKILKNFPESPY